MIQWYKSEDLLFLLEVHNSILKTILVPAFFNWTAETLTEELQIAKAIIFKGDHNRVDGFIVFRENSEAIEITVLATHRGLQKTGVMTRLIQFLQDYAAQQDKPIWLEVHLQNQAARQVYMKNAFEISHERKDYYRDGASACVLSWRSPPDIK